MASGPLLPPLRYRLSETTDAALDHIVVSHPDLPETVRVRCWMTLGGAVICDQCDTLRRHPNLYM